MANTFTYVIKARDDASAVVQGFANKAKTATNEVGDAATTSGGKFSGFAKVATAALSGIAAAKAFGAIKGQISAAISGASDLAEAQSKVGVVFGDSAGDINEWAKGAATALGLSKGEATAAAGTFGNLFTALGLGQGAAADMSTDVVELAADLGSFNNLGTDEVLEKLRAGLTGEAEPLKSLGIAFNAAAVEAKAMELGLADANGEIDESAKIQARMALIMEQTTNAQGDFARTSDGLANRQKILQARLTDVQVAIGAKLLPVVTAFAGFILNTLIPTVETVTAFIADHALVFGATAAAVGLAVGAVLVPAFLAWAGAAAAAAAATLLALAPIILPVLAIGAAVALLALAWETNFLGIRDITASVFDFIGPYLSETLSFVQGLFTTALSAIQTAWGVVFPALQAVVETVLPIVQTIVGTYIGGARLAIETAVGAIQTIWNTVFPAIQSAVEFLWPHIQTLVSENIASARAAIETALGVIETVWGRVWPAVQTIIETVLPIVKSVVETNIAAVQLAIETALPIIEGIWNTVWPAIQATVETVWAAILLAVETINAVRDLISTVMGEIQGPWDTAWGAIKATVDTVWNGVNGIGRLVDGGISGVATLLSGAYEGIQTGWDGFWGGIKGTVSGAVEAITGFVNTIIRGINALIGGWNGLSFSFDGFSIDMGPLGTVNVPGFTFDTPNVDTITELAKGGIVVDPTLAIIGEAGPEAVIPLSALGGAGLGIPGGGQPGSGAGLAVPGGGQPGLAPPDTLSHLPPGLPTPPGHEPPGLLPDGSVPVTIVEDETAEDGSGFGPAVQVPTGGGTMPASNHFSRSNPPPGEAIFYAPLDGWFIPYIIEGVGWALWPTSPPAGFGHGITRGGEPLMGRDRSGNPVDRGAAVFTLADGSIKAIVNAIRSQPIELDGEELTTRIVRRGTAGIAVPIGPRR